MAYMDQKKLTLPTKSDKEHIHSIAATGNLEYVKRVASDWTSMGKQISFESILAGAASEGHIEVMEYAVENGADVDYCHSFPLCNAISGRCIDAVDFLISNGAIVPDEVKAFIRIMSFVEENPGFREQVIDCMRQIVADLEGNG